MIGAISIFVTNLMLESTRKEITVLTDLKQDSTQERADSQQVAELIAEGKKATDSEDCANGSRPGLRRSGSRSPRSTRWWSGPSI